MSVYATYTLIYSTLLITITFTFTITITFTLTITITITITITSTDLSNINGCTAYLMFIPIMFS